MQGALADLNVSRETIERLEAYVQILTKWNSSINLVSPATLNEVWSRHIVDSAQIFSLAPWASKWADLGSGGGFPGLVIAILLGESNDGSMILVESDQRKSAFLRTALRETNTKAQVVAERIEETAPLQADILTARALAPLTRLLTFTERHQRPGGVSIFPKGQSWRAEIEAAQAHWRFHYDAVPSKTNPDSVVLKVGDVARV
ncbi:16S rRNA (guanine(527)-N(7))-methyltransferase RsmG [Pseudooceanicola sp.]|uniref:16S rRNA (guanine(527)-N(7))-methyltransferase RsmG n=1 Tax=Pseudooceanicola sp. TaxID=1914328 RepID=UPI002639DD41|nr:16S rRNA (guanine(527)-N(7))-methyltransferase RsmG [Pseudooceanicola sp.]MDF1854955.1 16S rRNA (guanine(527)-N(7))-methyltransferase RsmG [Pseudooceanicola sp.]